MAKSPIQHTRIQVVKDYKFLLSKSNAIKNLNSIFDNVKFASLLLALYVLLLSAKPCCIDDKCEYTDHATKTEHANEEKGNGNCNGDCPPFFSCGSCSGFSFQTISYSLKQEAVILEKQTVFYTNYFSSELFNLIWQPPKLS